MQALAAHSRRRRRLWPLILAAVVVVGAAAAGITIALHTHGAAGGMGDAAKSGAEGGHGATAAAGGTNAAGFTVVATTPQTGSAGVASNATVSVQFSAAPATGGPHPTLQPAVAGRWASANTKTLVFHATAPLVPGSTETVTVPGGSSGVRDQSGRHLAHKVTTTFTVAGGSTQRLQELLAQLGYLPLAYVPPTPAPSGADQAEPQPGALTWRWTMPTSLTSLWLTGSPNVITKAAVMSFERQNGLNVDGVAGPQVWSALLNDVASGKGDATPYSYVFVSKTPLPETLTLYVNGAVKNGGVPVNTGAPGATTLDGTYPVFEHVKASDMKGTNITGSTYNDPTVPWASYFNGGDALHGFPRSHYGYPQSNGCVEMPISEAALVWPYTPVGTLVTVVGLPNTPPKTPATTTTTTAPPATTTTAPSPAPNPAPAPATTAPAPATPPA